MKLLFTCVVAIFFFGCSSPTQKISPENKQKQILADQIRKKVSKELAERYGLVPFGSGGQMMHQIEMLMLAFTYNEPIDQNEARKLLVESVNYFASAINTDERIHSYLANFPFEPKNIQVEISLRDGQGRNLPEGHLTLITASKGSLEYDIRDPETHKLVTAHRETFEEAKQLLQKTSSDRKTATFR